MGILNNAKEAVAKLRPGSAGAGLVSKAETTGAQLATAAAVQRARGMHDDEIGIEENYPVGAKGVAVPSTSSPHRPSKDYLYGYTADEETGAMWGYQPDDPMVLRKLFGLEVDSI